MISDAMRSEFQLMANRAYADYGRVKVGESADGDTLFVRAYKEDGTLGHFLVRIEHDADKVAEAFWSALNALLPEKRES